MAQQYATAQYLERRVPQVSTLPPENDPIETALADAELMIGLDAYGVHAELAHAYYAAHLLACRFPAQLGGEAAGPVTMKKAGEVQVQFAVPAVGSSSEDRPNSTRWGRLFLQQQRLAGATLRVVG